MRPCLDRVLPLLLLALVPGCGERPSPPRLSVSLEGGPRVRDRLTVDFGAVQPSGTYTRWISLHNEGGLPAEVQGWTGDDSRDGLLTPPFGSDPPMPLTVAPGGSESVWLRFDPREPASSWEASAALAVRGLAADGIPRFVLSGATLPRPCRLTMSANPVDFGMAAATGMTERVLVLRNESPDPQGRCALHDLRIEEGGDPRLAFAAQPPGFTVLDPGEELGVHFAATPGPPALTSALAVFAFEVIGTRTETVRVPLSATFPSECLNSTAVDLGAAASCGDVSNATATVTNVCSGPVVVEVLDLSDPGGAARGELGCSNERGCAEFSATLPVTPLTIPAGGSVEIPVRYEPLNHGAAAGWITAQALHGEQPVIGRVDLRGSVSLPEARESHHNYIYGPLDVLFVIDDGPSMEARRSAHLSARLAEWIDYLAWLCADLNLAVISSDTSDPAKAGVFRSDVLNYLAAGEFKQQALAMLTLPSNANSTNAPLEAARLALSPPHATGANSGFRRPNARLIIAIVTDRVDDSPLGPADYDAFFQSLATVPSAGTHVMVAAGFDVPSNCGAAIDDGTLAQVATEAADLCDATWSAFQPWGRFPECDAFTTRYALMRAPSGPFPDAIEVFVNQAEVAPFDSVGAANWWFDRQERAIEFAKPPKKATIEIRYRPRCERWP